MSLVACRECMKEISSDAKKCPHCGVKNPYKKTWKDFSKLKKTFVIFGSVVTGFFILAMIANDANREKILLQELTTADKTDSEALYKIYSGLYESNKQNDEYISGLLTSGKTYLKSIPSKLTKENLEIYHLLNEAEPSNILQAKVDHYEAKTSFENDCTNTAYSNTKKLATNPATYDSGMIYGDWVSENEYYVVHNFSAKNAFGVTFEKVAKFICTVHYPPVSG
jgi:hypothetical protein